MSMAGSPPADHVPLAMNILIVHTQVFLLLVAEMALFMLLVIPLPFTLRRKIFTYVFPLLSSTLPLCPY